MILSSRPPHVALPLGRLARQLIPTAYVSLRMIRTCQQPQGGQMGLLHALCKDAQPTFKRLPLYQMLFPRMTRTTGAVERCHAAGAPRRASTSNKAPSLGPWSSCHVRLENPVRHRSLPHEADVRPSPRITAVSIGAFRYQRRPTGPTTSAMAARSQ